jgi:hypothetical protein
MWARSWKCTLPSSFLTSACSAFTSSTGLDLGRLLAGLLEHAGQLHAHAVVLHHQAGGRIDQAGGHAHVLGLVLQRFLQLGQHGLEGFGGFFGGLLLGLVLQLAQVHRALGHALQRRAVELVQVVQRPLVHAVGHQQHFDALLLEDFELRAVLGAARVSAVM